MSQTVTGRKSTLTPLNRAGTSALEVLECLRKLIAAGFSPVRSSGGAGVSLSGCSAPPAAAAPAAGPNPNYAKLDAVLKQPVLRRELFPTPVIIDTLELLRLDDSFICRVRSKDGAVGISASNNSQQRSLYPIQVNRLQPFFLGKDARDLEALLEEVYVYQSNYKLQSLALWVPLATIEFAILDMLGRIANKSLGQLVSEPSTTPRLPSTAPTANATSPPRR